MTRTVSALAVVAAVAPFAAAQPSPAVTLPKATGVLESIQAVPHQCIPAALLADAQGIAIIPHVIKAGFVVGGRGGHGVVYSRDANGAWAGPVFVDIGGASVGLQVGVQATDLVLVFKTRASLDRILRGQGKVTLGADAAVAAGPVGRQAAAATDGRLQAEIVSYSRSRGLFAGVSIDGAVLAADDTANREYQAARPEVVAWAEKLRAEIALASNPRPPAGTLPPMPPAPPVAVPVAPAVPQQPLPPQQPWTPLPSQPTPLPPR